MSDGVFDFASCLHRGQAGNLNELTAASNKLEKVNRALKSTHQQLEYGIWDGAGEVALNTRKKVAKNYEGFRSRGKPYSTACAAIPCVLSLSNLMEFCKKGEPRLSSIRRIPYRNSKDNRPTKPWSMLSLCIC